MLCLCSAFACKPLFASDIADSEDSGIEPEIYIKKEHKSLEKEHENADKDEHVDTIISSSKTYNEIIAEIKGAIKANQLKKAEKLIDNILSLDPANKRALMYKDDIKELNHRDIISDLRNTNSNELYINAEILDERSIPYTDLLRFPKGEESDLIETREIQDRLEEFENVKDDSSHLRLIPYPKGALPEQVEKALNKNISIEFYNTSLRDVIAFLQEKIDNINITLKQDVPDHSVNIKLHDVPVYVALKHLLPDGVNYTVEDEIIIISKDILEMRVYDVRDLLINLDDRSTAGNDSSIANRTGGSSSGGSSGGSASEGKTVPLMTGLKS